MIYLNFLLPGDTVKFKRQTLDFHKGQTYKVSNCYLNKDKSGLEIYAFNKYNESVKLEYYNTDYDLTAKTMDSIYKRILKTSLDFAWLYSNHIIDSHNRTEILFEIHTRSYYRNNPNAIGSINEIHIDEKTKNKTTVNTTYLNSKEEYYEFFENYVKEQKKNHKYYTYTYFRAISDRGYSQEGINYLMFFNEHQFEKEPSIIRNKKTYEDFIDEPFSEYQKYISLLVFDKPRLTENVELEFVKDVINIFKEVPASYGCTAIAKILYGTSKLKNKNLEGYLGKYKGLLKYDQLFEACSAINDYLYHHNIFKEKQYITTETDEEREWLGTFEYCGAKKINVLRLEEIYDSIKF